MIANPFVKGLLIRGSEAGLRYLTLEDGSRVGLSSVVVRISGNYRTPKEQDHVDMLLVDHVSMEMNHLTQVPEVTALVTITSLNPRERDDQQLEIPIPIPVETVLGSIEYVNAIANGLQRWATIFQQLTNNISVAILQ